MFMCYLRLVEFLRKNGKSANLTDPSSVTKTLKDPEIVELAFKELSKYHVGKLNGCVSSSRHSPAPY
jgi:hypothetical protein